MTPSPTPAEVQAAYDRLQICINPTDVDTLLAAVARDTMGWREVPIGQRNMLPFRPFLMKEVVMADGVTHLYIKDAAT